MKIKVLKSGKVETNTYFIINEINLNTIVIDPSDGIEDIVNYIKNNNLIVTDVLLTHGHFDHIAGAKSLQRMGAKIHMHEKDVYMIDNPLDMAKFLNIKIESFVVDDIINSDTILNLNGYKIKVIQTPGHSEGGVCFILDCAIFSGDTLFRLSYGRYDFDGGDFDKLKHSINKILSIEGNYEVYPGHGPMTILDFEKANNPLR